MPPPMAGPGLPGPGPSPLGQPNPAALQALGDLQKQPSPGGEEEALTKATDAVGMAMSRIYMRSPEAAKMLSEALSRIQSARMELQKIASAPVGMPPDLLGGITPWGGPIPSGLGMP